MNPLRLARRHAGIFASFAYSLANFSLLLLLQGSATPLEFGLFALAQVFVQFGNGLINAIVSAPIVVLAARAGTERAKAEMAASFIKAGFLFCLAGALIVGALVLTAGGDLSFSLLVVVLAVLSWFRWQLRSTELAMKDYRHPATADLAYATAVLAALPIALASVGLDAMSATVLQAFGCAAAMVVVGPGTWRIVRMAPDASWQPFGKSLRQHGRWTLLGVATTEATANAHAYLVGFFVGPAAFAPIAAVSLFFRPVTILTQALTQYERPRMAQSLQQGEGPALRRQLGQFGLLSVATWAVNSAGVFVLIWGLPGIIGNDAYPASALEVSAILLAGIFLFRAIRGGPSAALQAAGWFRPLAIASLLAAPVTLVGVAAAALLLQLDAPTSLLGVLAGEVVLCALILAVLPRRVGAS